MDVEVVGGEVEPRRRRAGGSAACAPRRNDDASTTNDVDVRPIDGVDERHRRRCPQRRARCPERCSISVTIDVTVVLPSVPVMATSGRSSHSRPGRTRSRTGTSGSRRRPRTPGARPGCPGSATARRRRRRGARSCARDGCFDELHVHQFCCACSRRRRDGRRPRPPSSPVAATRARDRLSGRSRSRTPSVRCGAVISMTPGMRREVGVEQAEARARCTARRGSRSGR